MYGDTELSVLSKVWLIDLDGQVVQVESNIFGQAFVDEMVASMQFVIQ